MSHIGNGKYVMIYTYIHHCLEKNGIFLEKRDMKLLNMCAQV